MCEIRPNKKLVNKVAIVTGGANGIGEEAASRFAAHGARAVVIADIEEEKGRSVAESIGLHCCTFIKCDVSDEAQVKSLVDWTIQNHGQLDIMFSNAGIVTKLHKQDILNFDFASYDNVFAVNVRGMIACVKHAGRAMVDCGVKGSIICTSSTVADFGASVQIDYAISKNAVVGLVKCASKGLGQYGTRINCISPGPIPTRLTCESLKMTAEEVDKTFESGFSLKNGSNLKVEHVADAVLFLASDDSKFVTGHNLIVDGGFVPRFK